VVASARKKFLAALAGVVLAGAPMGAFNLWLNSVVDGQGQHEVETTAKRLILVVESRFGKAIAGLDRLSVQGVDSCRSEHLGALRQAVFAIPPVKELAVVDPDGQTLCTDHGLPLGERNIISRQRVVGNGELLIEVMQIGERKEPMVRIRRPVVDTLTLAALIPTDMLMLRTSMQGNPLNAYARLALRNAGAASIVETGRIDREDARDRFSGTAASERYGLVAMVSIARASVLASHAHLHSIGLAITGVIALLIIAFALLVPWRAKGSMMAEIERALEAGEFVPYYQPVIDIRTGQLRGAEVLARWRKADGSVTPPAMFIPLMESSGLIVEFTRVLMRQARDEVGAAYHGRPHLRLGFNLAAQHLADDRIAADMRDIFDGSPVRLSQLVVEVTERQPIDNLVETRRVIAALQGLGVKIAIDDVGSGHSGLSYILKLGVDILKIDKMFIDAIGSDQNSSKIIETLVDLARNLRMDVIAEGVETFDQVVYLRNIGILAAQGYVFAPPLPGSSFLQLIGAIDPTPLPAEVEQPVPTRVLPARKRAAAA
jgi:sensor c-di-GMP phosphodiesterase-like protein